MIKITGKNCLGKETLDALEKLQTEYMIDTMKSDFLFLAVNMLLKQKDGDNSSYDNLHVDGKWAGEFLDHIRWVSSTILNQAIMLSEMKKICDMLGKERG